MRSWTWLFLVVYILAPLSLGCGNSHKATLPHATFEELKGKNAPTAGHMKKGMPKPPDF